MPAVAAIGLRETENRSNVTALSLLSITICNFLFFSFPLTSTLHIHIDSTLAYQCCAIHHFVFCLALPCFLAADCIRFACFACLLAA